MGTVPCAKRICKERGRLVGRVQHLMGPKSHPLDVGSEDPHADHGVRDGSHRALRQRIYRGRRYVLIGPGVAKILADGGYTKQSLRQDLMKTGRKITYEAVFSKVYGTFGHVYDSFAVEHEKALKDKNTAKRKLPPWYPRFPGWEGIETTPAIRHVEFIVCGDSARNKVQTLAGGPGTAIKEIKLPAKWDELMEKAGYRPLREFFLK